MSLSPFWRTLIPLTMLLGGSALAGAGSPSIEGRTWTLQQISPTGKEVVAVKIGQTPTLRIDGRRASGSTGCNTFTAVVVWNRSTLRLNKMAMTRKACPDLVLSLEADVVNILSHIQRYTLKGDTLTIYGKSNARLIYTNKGAMAMTDLSQISGEWNVKELVAKDKTYPVAKDALLSLSAGTLLQISGKVGCNQLRSSASNTGGQFRFQDVSFTRMMCGPSEAKAETALAQVLAVPVSLTQNRDELMMQGQNGHLRLQRAASVRQAERQYVLKSVNGHKPEAYSREVTLILGNGEVKGVDGCNPYHAQGKITNGKLELTSPPIAGMAYCPELQTLPWLSVFIGKSPVVQENGDELQLSDGKETWIFSRSK